MKIKRVYDPPAHGDGARILVDRLWPRGLSKRAAAVDAWIKDVAPSAALRTWFGHDPARWPVGPAGPRSPCSSPPATL